MTAPKVLPAGRELDSVVALALYPGGDIDHPEHPAYGRLYSTDPRLQDDLLAAIHKETGNAVSIHVDPDRAVAGTSGRNARYGDGPTISVALCRLLLAVKGAQ